MSLTYEKIVVQIYIKVNNLKRNIFKTKKSWEKLQFKKKQTALMF